MFACSESDSNIDNGQNKVEQEATSSENNQGQNTWKTTSLKLKAGDKNYNIEIEYYEDANTGLTAFSDGIMMEDANGDNICVAIFQQTDRLTFDFKDKETLYSALGVNWNRTNKLISGSGKLHCSENGRQNEQMPFSFELILIKDRTTITISSRAFSLRLYRHSLAQSIPEVIFSGFGFFGNYLFLSTVLSNVFSL